MLEFRYRNATQEETDDRINHKCVIILGNHMQCDHKVAKVATIKEKPEDVGTVVYYCEAHFIINMASLKTNDGLSIIDSDTEPTAEEAHIIENTPSTV